MQYKTYRLNRHLSRWSTQVAMEDGSTQFITFDAVGFGTTYATGNPVFATKNVKLQQAIEASKFFQEGTISVIDAVDAEEDETDVPKKKRVAGIKQNEPAEFPEVTKLREVKEILTGEPYNVNGDNEAFKSKEAAAALAAELGVSFPNF